MAKELGVKFMFKMLRNIIKNLFSRPATRKYPFIKREPFKNVRGHIDIDITNCILCGLCERKCPSNAIKVSKLDKAWQIDPYKCIICNVCVEACPQKCIFTQTSYRSPEYEKTVYKKVKG